MIPSRQNISSATAFPPPARLAAEAPGEKGDERDDVERRVRGRQRQGLPLVDLRTRQLNSR